MAYIITDVERKAFKALTTDEDREYFIKDFWLFRDPTPGTPENEFKDEHYRRIAYANEHFAGPNGLPGWKTDRGRIYITYGPPDEIEDHSSGGFYQRPAAEGGGTTSTFPFQQWRYKFIQGVGNNIIIEFVDPTNTGEFRMTTDPSEKDALLAGQPDATALSPSGNSAVPFSRAAAVAAPAVAWRICPPSANIFVSAGDGPKVTVAITGEKRNTNVNVALPPGAGIYDVIAAINRRAKSDRRQSPRRHPGRPDHLWGRFRSGARLLHSDSCDAEIGLPARCKPAPSASM